VREIQPRCPALVDPLEQRQKVSDLLEKIRNVSIGSDPASRDEAEDILSSLPDTLRNPDHFVAGGFTSSYPAWEALLQNSKRKSAKTVLGWLRKGVKPQSVGSAEAKENKRALVVGMLKRQVPAKNIPNMLSGDRPHPIAFANHKLFYDNLEFALGEASKLVLWSAASI
jgi:hypothetical protein